MNVKGFTMRNFKVGDRVYHIRRGDPHGSTGFGTITWIEGTRATLLWEHNGKTGGVAKGDLISENEATAEGLE
jgi:hypothetical protein